MDEIQFNKAYLTITSKCNLKCDYCYVKTGKNKELTTSEWKKILKTLKEHGVNWVQLTGGEPLMRDDFWEILEECYNKFDKVILTTNALLIDDEKISRFSNFKDIIFYISLNYWTEKKDDDVYLKKIDVIKKLKKHGKIVCLLTTLSNENFKDLPKIIDFAQKNKLEWKINFISLIGRANQNMLDPVTWEFLKNYQENDKDINISIIPPCEAGFYNISILENGDVTPCPLGRDKSFIGGNILKNDLEKIYNSNVMKKWREESSKIDKACIECKNFMECKGGCPIRKMTYAKSFNKKIFVDAAVCSWNQSFEKLGLNSKMTRLENKIET
jgi:radical SAM protein with 4Fe4S-binding SPASM domain